MKTALLSLLLSTAALAQTCDYYPLTTCSQTILGPKSFPDGIIANITSDGGSGVYDSLYVRGDAGVGGNVGILGGLTGNDAGFRDVTVAGDAGVLTNFYAAGTLTVAGASTVAALNGQDAGFRDVTVAGDAGVLNNLYVAGTMAAVGATVNGSPVATYANGQAGGSIEMYHPTAYTGSKAVARVLEHPINANTQMSLSWVPQVAGSVGGTMAVYLKDTSASNHVIAGLNAVSCTATAGTFAGTLYLADGGADAGDTIGLFIDVSGCSGTIPDGTADVSW